jgi:hypothetical protein
MRHRAEALHENPKTSMLFDEARVAAPAMSRHRLAPSSRACRGTATGHAVSTWTGDAIHEDILRMQAALIDGTECSWAALKWRSGELRGGPSTSSG